MNAPASYRVRRATIDDLEKLNEVWRAAHLPAAELEQQFTDFQVAEAPDGRIVGAIAMRVHGFEGHVHSETFPDFALSDAVRPLLWQRLETVAKNHGLFKLWTLETAPFWKKAAGFVLHNGAPPAVFSSEPTSASWLVLRLKDEGANPDLLEAQFEMFRDAERAKREVLLQRAAALKTVGTLIAVLVFVFAMVVLMWFFRHRPH